MDQLNEAIQLCLDCAAKPQLHKNLGLIYARAGDSENAVTQLLLAQELMPADPEISQALNVVRKSLRESN